MDATLHIDDAIYRQAEAEARREGMTLAKFVEEALRLRLARGTGATADSGLRQREVAEQSQTEQESADNTNRAALVAELQRLFAWADERDRLKEGGVGPLSREELYAERLDRFR